MSNKMYEIALKCKEKHERFCRFKLAEKVKQDMLNFRLIQISIFSFEIRNLCFGINWKCRNKFFVLKMNNIFWIYYFSNT